MQPRTFVSAMVLFVTMALCAVTIIAVYGVAGAAEGSDDNRAALATAATSAVLVCMFLVWWSLERYMLRPQRRLARNARARVESRSTENSIALPASHAVADLAEAFEELGNALKQARDESEAVAKRATAEVDEQKAWLETILQGLREGVLVCNRQHRLLLYNRSALNILGNPESIGLGRSVLELISGAALKHTLARLEHRYESGVSAPGDLTAPFVCSRANAQGLFHGRMALIDDGHGRISGYLVTLEDISAQVNRMAQREAVYRALSRDLRGVVANLRAAAEALGHPDMSAAERSSFDRVVLDESNRLSRYIDELAEHISPDEAGAWPLADVYLADLIRCLEERLADTPDLQITLVGQPLWIYGDSLTLLQALECLVRNIYAQSGASKIVVETLLSDRRVYVDMRWRGPAISAAELSSWLEQPCGEVSFGGQRLVDALERHGCEPWSYADERSAEAVLRLPLLAPERPQFQVPDSAPLPARPEFYDFKLIHDLSTDHQFASRPLNQLRCVVFDCEMTGLDPDGGDEIISIAGVRVVNRRVLTGETFNRIIDPGRSIPPASVRFHGLTDEDVRGQPPIEQVLPEFKQFVGDDVLIAHNAAFDMKFLAAKEKSSGVRFDNPVLDTLLLSVLLDGEEEDHSLDNLCQRYSVTMSGRHTALGDTLATAELLVRLFERLEARGYKTFGEVTKASHMAAELRHRSAAVSAQQSGFA
ncbi:PAS domain-containing protein [Halorhodospira halochloris]|uniref:3'-5' exonuclease n=1 Tax=Halorhodospira halochloris TaxID=1052 RepID=UPI001EE80245|nr:PAS domain-containing protein [Halorhodospira halochloris]